MRVKFYFAMLLDARWWWFQNAMRCDAMQCNKTLARRLDLTETGGDGLSLHLICYRVEGFVESLTSDGKRRNHK